MNQLNNTLGKLIAFHSLANGVRLQTDFGTVEIIVDVKQAVAWGDTLGRFFDKLERDCDSWRDAMRNKTVIVNFVDLR